MPSVAQKKIVSMRKDSVAPMKKRVSTNTGEAPAKQDPMKKHSTSISSRNNEESASTKRRKLDAINLDTSEEDVVDQRKVTMKRKAKTAPINSVAKIGVGPKSGMVDSSHASAIDVINEAEASKKKAKQRTVKAVRKTVVEVDPVRAGAIDNCSKTGDKAVTTFTQEIVTWYEMVRRNLPWRRNPRNAYGVLVSEVMLQQTRVATVIPYWEKWMKKWPTIQDLAVETSTDTILEYWSGLGYYRRARCLKNIADVCKERNSANNGDLYEKRDDLKTLPGIGPYTASAVASICHAEPVGVVDGNVARVLHRYFAVPGYSVIEAWQWEAMDKFAAAKETPADIENVPSYLNQGVMELGATVCVPQNPLCSECPVRRGCAVSLKKLDPMDYGRKGKKVTVPTKKFQVLVDCIWDEKTQSNYFGLVRENGNLLTGQYRFPYESETKGKSSSTSKGSESSSSSGSNVANTKINGLGFVKHVFSSQVHEYTVSYSRRQLKDIEKCYSVTRNEANETVTNFYESSSTVEYVSFGDLGRFLVSSGQKKIWEKVATMLGDVIDKKAQDEKLEALKK